MAWGIIDSSESLLQKMIGIGERSGLGVGDRVEV